MTTFQRIRNKLRFKIQGNEDRNVINQFCRKKDYAKRVLLFEVNSCHGEVIPGYIKYFYDLGYKVDVLMNNTLGDLQPLSRVPAGYIDDIYSCNIRTIKSILKSEQISKYKYVCATSNVIYTTRDIKSCPCLIDFIPDMNIRENQLLIVQHHLDRLNTHSINKYKTIILADIPPVSERKNTAVANPHFFGDIKITPKNALANFIIVGSIENHRRNYDLLVNTVKELVNNGVDNFKITVIGWRGKLPAMRKPIRKYFHVKGSIAYPELYDELEKADFFLPMLDPDNKEHDKYLATTTSGSFQLIYGFRIPCLLAKKFAKMHGFNRENCLIYEKNQDLAKLMTAAINMSREEYSEKQNNLSNYTNILYENSLKNLKNLLND
jgi:hypothetical protein